MSITEEMKPSSLQFHDFETESGEIKIAGHVLIMEESFYLWVGDKAKNLMNDFCVAFPSEYDSQPITTKLIGPVADTTSMNIAKRLSKKFKKPVYVSFNLQVDNLSLPGIEKCLQQELEKFSDLVS